MKKLLLVRHAKAGSHHTDDFTRPLTDKGIRDAEFMANELQKDRLLPEYILTSSALRTQTTANIIAKALNIPHQAANKAIYEAGTHTLFTVINELPNEYEFIGLVGHNPGISYLVYELTGEMREMPTAGIALITFEVDSWELVHTNTGRVAWYNSPKEY